MTHGIGAHRPDDYRGWLVFGHLPEDLQRAEDATQAADHAHLRHTGEVSRTRRATEAEHALLTHLGHELPEVLFTRVTYLSAGVRNRRWPALETTEGI